MKLRPLLLAGIILVSFSSASVQESSVVPHSDPEEQREFQNVYQAIKNPTINVASISSGTITNEIVSVSTITYLSVTGKAVVPNGSLLTDAAAFGQILGYRVLQIVSATTSTAANSTSSTFIDTNLSCSITPTLSTSKILIIAFVNLNVGASTDADLRILRGASTVVYGPVGVFYGTASLTLANIPVMAVDSPGTTTSTTYKVQFARGTGTNSCQAQGGGIGQPAQSQIFLFEIG